jgi:hypothetical protein
MRLMDGKLVHQSPTNTNVKGWLGEVSESYKKAAILQPREPVVAILP